MFQFQDGSIKCYPFTHFFSSLSLFQFQDGSIKWKRGESRQWFLLCFNSKMVRLNVSKRPLLSLKKQSFNSKMVRLNVIKYYSSSHNHPRFNSKMVRLNVPETLRVYSDSKEFQFQDGSIKCVFSKFNCLACALFQFQDGSIKWSLVPTLSSIVIWFQFQDGSIKC